MGRKSKAKEARSGVPPGPLRDALSPFTTASLRALVEAASASPTSSHRQPSLGLIVDATLRRKREGKERAPSSALSSLLEAAHRQEPMLASLEDTQGLDPRPTVVVRWRGALYRLLPGSLERPVAMIDLLHLLATVVDPALVSRDGFGLGDVTELLLRRIDQVATTLATTWGSGEMPAPGDLALVTDSELDAAQDLPPIQALLEKCGNPEAAEAALRTFSVDPRELKIEVDSPTSMFGLTMAVTQRGGQAASLPASLLVEALFALGESLALRAVSLDPSVEDRWSDMIANRIGHALQGAGHHVLGPVSLATGGQLHSITRYDDTRILAIATVASLDPSTFGDQVQAASRALSELHPGETIEVAGQDIEVDPASDIARILVLATPGGSSLFAEHKGEAVATLADMVWFARTSMKSPADIWHFAKDWADPAGLLATFAWDVIDAWEVWRANGKAFYTGAVPVSMTFAPHHAEVEWSSAAELSPLEDALLLLKEMPAYAWPMIEAEGDDLYQIGDLTADIVYWVLAGHVPTAVRATDPAAPAGLSSFVWSLAFTLRWKLQHIPAIFQEAAARSGVRGFRVAFSFVEDLGGELFRLKAGQGEGLTIEWSQSLREAAAADSEGVESLLGRVVSEAFQEEVRPEFMTAWDSAPPGIRLDAIRRVHAAQSLRPARSPHASVRSSIARRLAAFLMDKGIQPGRLEREEARDLESQVIYPELRRILHEAMSAFQPRALLLFALAQFEAANSSHIQALQRLGWQLGFPEHESDLEAQAHEDSTEQVALARAIGLVVEELLASPPAGQEAPKGAAWEEIVSVAALCLESGLRSEFIHLDLLAAATEISHNYELHYLHPDGPGDVDMERYAAARNRATLPEAIPISANTDSEPQLDDGSVTPIPESMPALREPDSAMRRSLGFGLDALANILNTAMEWDVSDSDPVGVTASENIVEQTAAVATHVPPEELRGALAWLTLSGSDLRDQGIEHWEIERRRYRLSTRPFVALGDERFLLPWSSEGALRLLANYLGDGRLPWPDVALPVSVVQAFKTYRQQLNDELELEVVQRLSEAGLKAYGSLKPGKGRAYGLQELRGEIDALAVDPSRGRIWVIEAKDPHVSFSGRQIRNQVAEFLGEGGYVDKLMGKVEDVVRDTIAIVGKLNITPERADWQVVPLMVTRHPEAAAFARSARVAFCTIDELPEMVTSEELPRPGANS